MELELESIQINVFNYKNNLFWTYFDKLCMLAWHSWTHFLLLFYFINTNNNTNNNIQIILYFGEQLYFVRKCKVYKYM